MQQTLDWHLLSLIYNIALKKALSISQIYFPICRKIAQKY